MKFNRAQGLYCFLRIYHGSMQIYKSTSKKKYCVVRNRQLVYYNKGMSENPVA